MSVTINNVTPGKCGAVVFAVGSVDSTGKAALTHVCDGTSVKGSNRSPYPHPYRNYEHLDFPGCGVTKGGYEYPIFPNKQFTSGAQPGVNRIVVGEVDKTQRTGKVCGLMRHAKGNSFILCNYGANVA
ncbi:unnamed protein product [Rhizoctonia solani]|uniref:Uncharacterized protein n=1 Tax=Rhizoctonia solani TaxID=456999 RepID=A0A8H3HPC9_9AGAM|nr:unnamed protein product [Rhizoctonia solani]